MERRSKALIEVSYRFLDVEMGKVTLSTISKTKNSFHVAGI